MDYVRNLDIGQHTTDTHTSNKDNHLQDGEDVFVCTFCHFNFLCKHVVIMQGSKYNFQHDIVNKA